MSYRTVLIDNHQHCVFHFSTSSLELKIFNISICSILDILARVKCCVVLVWLPLLIRDVEHLCIELWIICVLSFEACLVRSFIYFSVGLLALFIIVSVLPYAVCKYFLPFCTISLWDMTDARKHMCSCVLYKDRNTFWEVIDLHFEQCFWWCYHCDDIKEVCLHMPT